VRALFIVGFGSLAMRKILKNIQKGGADDSTWAARVHEKTCRKVRHQGCTGGLPSSACRAKRKTTINKTIDFAKELDCRNHPGFAGRTPCPGRSLQRPDVQGRFLARGSFGPTRVDTSCHNIEFPASFQGRYDGGRDAFLLRRILFPSPRLCGGS